MRFLLVLCNGDVTSSQTEKRSIPLYENAICTANFILDGTGNWQQGATSQNTNNVCVIDFDRPEQTCLQMRARNIGHNDKERFGHVSMCSVHTNSLLCAICAAEVVGSQL